MIKDQILNDFKKLLPIEQMEVCITLQLEILKRTGADQSNPLLKDTLEQTLKGLRHE